jgi:hypothetical protein
MDNTFEWKDEQWYKLKNMWEEAGLAYFKVQYQQLLKENKETHKGNNVKFSL